MRPSHAFAAALMATSLVAVAIPAYAADPSAAPTDVASTIQSGLTPADGSSTVSPSASDSAAPPTPASPSASSSAPANPVTGPLGSLTSPPASCTAALGGDPTKIQTCLTDAAAAGGGGGGLPPQLAGVQTFLTCASGAKTTLAGETCAEALFKALGIPDSQCLNPAVNPILAALDALITNQDPSKLQAELTGLGTELPKELTQVQACLMPTATGSATPAPTPAATATATTDTSGAATSDPAAAVAVAATPTFTG